MKCNLDGDTTAHISGLRVMAHNPETHGAVCHLTVSLPSRCCPVSGNPQPGSVLTLRYRPRGLVLETYSLEALLKQFKGGFPGVGPYRVERNMEGMVGIVAQMVADALGVRVRARASLLLDTGQMVVSVTAKPQEAKP